MARRKKTSGKAGKRASRTPQPAPPGRDQSARAPAQFPIEVAQPTPAPTLDQDEAPAAARATPRFPVVGIGASAGGLEAFRQFFDALPPDTGMAFVLIQHLDPTHQSMLTELIGRSTRMQVREVTGDTPVAPNCVDVIPPNTYLEIRGGVLRLAPRPEGPNNNRPVDHFFASLAEDCGNLAIGIVFSGAGNDGAAGVRYIHAEGGITFAQEERSAKFESMPRAAIAAGVDFVLKPEAIAKELANIAKHPVVNGKSAVDDDDDDDDEILPADDLSRILIMLRVKYGLDFSQYKPTTIRRRVTRRMVLHRTQDLKEYAAYLRRNEEALADLYSDLLISVTAFFRDTEAYEALREKVFPHIMNHRSRHDPIRIWVPGCSSGEEVYSIAIVLFEFLDEARSETPVQMFGTDVNERSIEKARSGVYADPVLHEVSPERLRRFFVKVPGHDRYRISSAVRDVCVFARQNMIKDPPFSRLDLISCRNVLIYFGANLQRQVMPIFHYALKPDGMMILGGAEGIAASSNLFDVVDRKAKIFIKRPGSQGISVGAVVGLAPQTVQHKTPYEPKSHLTREAEGLAAAQQHPCGVIVDSDYAILQFRGRTENYLDFVPNAPGLDVLKAARRGLAGPLRDAIEESRRHDRIAKRERIWTVGGLQARHINITVFPMQVGPGGGPNFLILLEDSFPPTQRRPITLPPPAPRGRTVSPRREIALLRRELTSTQEYLQSLVEEQESASEELRSANEEILSSNEELQSTNEELETAKEELQSTNEELTTLNEELQNRNIELHRANNDLANLLNSVNLPIIMLNHELRIQHFTSQARKVLNLIQSDTGRPIGDIKLNIDVPNLEEMVTEAIDNVVTEEREVTDRSGHTFSLQVRPYRTADNRIDGAVLILFDIEGVRAAERRAAEAGFAPVRQELEAAVAQRTAELEAITNQLKEREARLEEAQAVANVGSWNWDASTGKLTWSDELYRITGVQLGAGVTLENTAELVHHDDRERLRDIIQKARNDRKPFAVECRLKPRSGGELCLLIHGHIEATRGGAILRVFGTAQDVTSLKRAEHSLRELSSRLLRLQEDERRHIARELHDSTAQSLAALSMNLSTLSESVDGLDKARRSALFEAQALAEQCSREIRTMSYLLHPPLLEEAGLLPALKWYVEGFQKRSGVNVNLKTPESLSRMSPEIEITVFRIVQEALANVHRHSGASTAEIELAATDGQLRLEVRDDGRGIDVARLQDTAVNFGVGILGMRERVRQLDGTLEIEKGKQGTVVRALIHAHPLQPPQP